jgi:hypothetical protein
VHLVYIDDSHDNANFCFSALILDASRWYDHFAYLKTLRRELLAKHGIYVTKELHATDFIGGRGNIANRILDRGQRVSIYNWFLEQLAAMPGLSIIHGCMQHEETVFERILNRIDRTMQARNDVAMLISDQGKNYDGMLRRMRYVNTIPSAYGAWPDGSVRQNIPIQHIIEDLVYRDSKRSMFIQAADFSAFALLRFLKPTPAARRFGFDSSLHLLEPVIFKTANRRCPYNLGVVGQ